MGKTIDEFVREDKSILHRCMYALSTGKTLDKSMDGVLWDNERAVSFAISDMIRNFACKSMGSFMKFRKKHSLCVKGGTISVRLRSVFLLCIVNIILDTERY